jgi:hypothetical protein
MGALLRRVAFAGIEALVCSRARRALDVSQSFGDDALGYYTERLNPAVTRWATVTAVRQVKRHKAFDDCLFLLAWPWMAPAPDDRGKRFVICVVPTGTSKGRSSATTTKW